VTALLAALHGMAGAYAHLAATGSSTGDATPLYDFGDLTKLMGFQEVWDFEKQHAD
jgi:2,3-dimethylmalate lyase